jgi:hypothetical protein
MPSTGNTAMMLGKCGARSFSDKPNKPKDSPDYTESSSVFVPCMISKLGVPSLSARIDSTRPLTNVSVARPTLSRLENGLAVNVAPKLRHVTLPKLTAAPPVKAASSISSHSSLSRKWFSHLSTSKFVLFPLGNFVIAI